MLIFVLITRLLFCQAPRLTFLQWFNPPQSTITAGEKFQTFSATGDEGITDRVRLEEKRNRLINKTKSIP
jgi:hypothetical protein